MALFSSRAQDPAHHKMWRRWHGRRPVRTEPRPRSKVAAFVAKAKVVVAQAKVLPLAYATWWRRLFRESPEHVLVETLLIVFLVWVMWAGRKQKAQKSAVTLKKEEVDELVDEWRPEPLVSSKRTELVREIATRAKVVTAWDAASGGRVTLRTKNGEDSAWLLNCGSFAFLGPGSAGDSSAETAAKRALEKYGCGSCGPRGFYGSIDVHEELEAKTAEFFGAEKAIAFSDAASCATSTIAAFAKRGDLLVVDERISEPLRTGCLLSRANVTAFAHNDVAALEKVLKAVAKDDAANRRAPGTQRRFVVTEAVSRDACDVAPLEPVVDLCRDYGYRLILDEGLSFGVLGATGRGLREHCGLSPTKKVDVTIVDLGPALGSVGGLCLGDHDVVEHQRLSGAGYCFSAAAPPFVSAVALAALDRLDDAGSSELLAKLRANAKSLRDGLRDAGLVPTHFAAPTLANALDDVVPVVHLALARPSGVHHADLATLDDLADALADAGFAVAVVKHGLERCFKPPSTLLPPLPPAPLALKFATNASHDPDQLAALCAALKAAVDASPAFVSV